MPYQLINIIDVLRHAFEYHDPRLINHGERVAYILMKLLEDNPSFTDQEKQDIFMLGLLHDIGAYKEEEVDTMLSFDARDSMEHSIFGYLLFKTFSPLPEYADCILYHHNHDARYHSVRISKQHREIAKLIHLADRIDIFFVHNGAKMITSLMQEPSIRSVFSEKDLQNFLECDKKHSILENLASKAYLEQLSDYTARKIILTEPQLRAYLMTYLFSIDFRNEYTVLHSSYAINLCEKFTQKLHLTKTTLKTTQLAAMLHNIGKVSLPMQINSPAEFEQYLKKLYQPSVQKVTHKILTDAVDPHLISTIEQSSLLVECFLNNERITFAPSPAEEIVALSYFISNNTHSEASHLNKSQLLNYLTRKYEVCSLEDSTLRALIKNYDSILQDTKVAADSVRNSYRK